MLYSMRSALCKSEAGNDLSSGILRGSGKVFIADRRVRGAEFAAQAKAVVAQGHRPALGVLVGFFFAREALDLTSEPSARRRGAARGDPLGALNGFSVETDRNVLLRLAFCACHVLPRIGL